MARHWDPRSSGWRPAGKQSRRRTGKRWFGKTRSPLPLVAIALGLGIVSQLDSMGGDAVPALPSAGASGPTEARASLRVIDGDTFDFGGQRIRIADIDTPELRGACEEEKALARAATGRLRALLAEGPFELRRLGRDEDRYGRKLRVVMRGGRSIGDRLVAEGLARTWTGRREPWC